VACGLRNLGIRPAWRAGPADTTPRIEESLRGKEGFETRTICAHAARVRAGNTFEESPRASKAKVRRQRPKGIRMESFASVPALNEINGFLDMVRLRRPRKCHLHSPIASTSSREVLG